MKDNDYYYFEDDNWQSPSEGAGDSWDTPVPGGGSWLAYLRQLWQWDELAAEIGQESQARVALVGLAGSGKSLLFNRLRGWTVSGADTPAPADAAWHLDSDLALESLGLFVLADLPTPVPPLAASDGGLMLALGNPTLVVYLLDGARGVTAPDYRWVAALRAAGTPLLIVLNKIDLAVEPAKAAAEAERRLGMPVIPISAHEGTNVEEQLLPAMLNAVPRLAVPLGRELLSLRRTASRRVIRQAALFSGVVGVQPVPVLDLPFQAMIQVGVVMRIGAAYGYVPTGSMNREVLGTVAGTLGMRYLALALVKLIPFIGWAAAGALSGAMTFLIGEAAIRYYEAGATIPLRELLPSDVRLRPNGRFPRRLSRNTQEQASENEGEEEPPCQPDSLH